MKHIASTPWLVVGSLVVGIVGLGNPAFAQNSPWTLGFSFGQEIQFKPPPAGQARATSVMVSPGYRLTENIRVELGLSYILDAYRDGKSEIEIRPNLRVQLPGHPYYGRLNLGIAHVMNAGKGEMSPSLGISLGRSMEIATMPLYLEVALNPRPELTKNSKIKLFWIGELRLGFQFPLGLE